MWGLFHRKRWGSRWQLQALVQSSGSDNRLEAFQNPVKNTCYKCHKWQKQKFLRPWVNVRGKVMHKSFQHRDVKGAQVNIGIFSYCRYFCDPKQAKCWRSPNNGLMWSGISVPQEDKRDQSDIRKISNWVSERFQRGRLKDLSSNFRFLSL